MSFRERRERDERRARERAVVGMRDLVIAAQAGFLGSLGSAAIADAVDEALAGMKPAECLGDPERVKGLWIYRASCRLINQQKSAEMAHREPIAIDEHAQALTVSVSGELGELNEDARQCWRLEEIVDSVQDDEQLWADALAERVLHGSLKPGALPRGLSTQLGWTASKTKDVSERARLKMVAFVQERASGSVCADRQALLERFIATDTSRGDGQRPALELKRYMAVVLHVGGCHECSLAWRERHRKFLGALPGVLALPFGAVAWAKRVLHELASSVDIATLSVRQRLGLGGGASVVTGGGAATLTTKTATVCAAAACAVGAGSEVVILAPIAPDPVHQTARKHPARHHASREHARRVVTPTRTRAPAPAPPTRPAAQATRVADAPVAPEQDFTPGDLPPASSTQAGGSSNASQGGASSAPADLPSASVTPPPPPPATGGDGAHCVLGDLEC